MEVLQEQLYEWGDLYSKNKDKTVRKIGDLLLEAHDTIDDLQEETKSLKVKLRRIAKSGVGDKNQILPELKRQNEILTEYRNLSEVLGLGRKDEDVIPPKVKTVLQQLSTRYSNSRTTIEKLDILAGIALVAADQNMSARALKLSRSGGLKDE